MSYNWYVKKIAKPFILLVLCPINLTKVLMRAKRFLIELLSTLEYRIMSSVNGNDLTVT